MKIFNWVHNRFSNKARNGTDNCDENSNVLERWSGGILTIGTFGYDQLKINDTKEQDDVIMSFHEEKEEESVECKSDDQITDHHLKEEKEEVKEETENEETEREETEHEEEANSFVYADHCDTVENGLEFEYVMMKKKERITLADLFCADHRDSLEDLHPKQSIELVENRANNCKKLDCRPIHHKLHRLVRRMLKRKIHPHHHPSPTSKVSMITKYDANDHHASLLPTQDGVK